MCHKWSKSTNTLQSCNNTIITMLLNEQLFINQLIETTKIDVDDFVTKFLQIHHLELEMFNKKKDGRLKVTSGLRTNKNTHAALCKFLLYWCLRHKFRMTHKAIVMKLDPNNKPNREASFYLVKQASQCLVTKDIKLTRIFDTTIYHFSKVSSRPIISSNN